MVKALRGGFYEVSCDDCGARAVFASRARAYRCVKEMQTKEALTCLECQKKRSIAKKEYEQYLKGARNEVC